MKLPPLYKELFGSPSVRLELGFTARLIRRAMREGWRRGVVGGSPTWTVAGGLALLGYMAGRAWQRESEVIFSERLSPGQTFAIAHEHVSLQ